MKAQQHTVNAAASHEAFVGLGSNIGEGRTQLQRALDELDALSNVEVLRVSSLYRSAAWGLEDQADFSNAVAVVGTSLGALDLLDRLQQIEQKMGRFRDGTRWGPRIIDLDLLYFDQQEISAARLQLPHPRISQRAFVLLPLAELEPDREFPQLGRAADHLAAVQEQRISRVPGIVWGKVLHS